jgi:hypothetical protein
MSEANAIRQKLRKRVAVKVGTAAKALGVGRYLLKEMIKAGTVPTNGVGNVPCDWLLDQMSSRRSRKTAAPSP